MPNRSFAFRIYIIALILRLIPVFLARGLGIGLDDMFQYDMLARSLASGNGFRWYAKEDLNQLASFVDFDLSSVRDYDPVRGIPTSQATADEAGRLCIPHFSPLSTFSVGQAFHVFSRRDLLKPFSSARPLHR